MLTAHTYERRPLGSPPSFEKRSIMGTQRGGRESENGYSLFSYWSRLVDGVLGNKWLTVSRELDGNKRNHAKIRMVDSNAKHIAGHLFISDFHKNYRQKEESIGSIPDALVWFGLVLIQVLWARTLKSTITYNVHQTNSMTDSLTVRLTCCWDFSACCCKINVLPSVHCMSNLDTVPGFFLSPEVLGHQQIVGYQIPPFWLTLETSICNHSPWCFKCYKLHWKDCRPAVPPPSSPTCSEPPFHLKQSQ